MFKREDSTQHVASRLLDYFGRRTPWQRRLWNVGSILALRETIEAAELTRRGHLTSKSLKDLTGSLKRKLGRDSGVGEAGLRRHLQRTLDEVEKDDRVLAELRYLVPKVESDYLARWRAEVQTQHEHGAEYISRVMGAHLLDAGFSPEHLHRWTTALLHSKRTITLPNLFSEAADLLRRPRVRYEILVPVTAIPGGSTLPDEWRSASEVRKWLQENAGSPPGVRQSGGFVYEVEERDPWAAVERATDLMRGFAARIAVGLPGDPSFATQTKAWIAGKEQPFGFSSPRRQVDVHSLDRQGALFLVDSPGLEQRMSSALEFLAALEIGRAHV